MITKIESISYTKNALEYCERGGELLTQHKCFGKSTDVYIDMKENNSLNEKCKNPTFHIKIRPAPEDCGKLNNQQFVDIAESYANEVGFQNNPYAVYIHEEGTDKEHIHIVASRIKTDNTAVSDSFLFYKNLEFSKNIEMEYGLRQVKRPNYKEKETVPFVSNDKRKLALVKSIESAIQFSDNMVDFIDLLKVKDIKVKLGRGIGFTDADGVSFKGSALGRQFSLSSIRGQINENNDFKIERKYDSIKVSQECTRASVDVSNRFLPDTSIFTPIISGNTNDNNDDEIDEMLGKKKKKKKRLKR